MWSHIQTLVVKSNKFDSCLSHSPTCRSQLLTQRREKPKKLRNWTNCPTVVTVVHQSRKLITLTTSVVTVNDSSQRPKAQTLWSRCAKELLPKTSAPSPKLCFLKLCRTDSEYEVKMKSELCTVNLFQKKAISSSSSMFNQVVLLRRVMFFKKWTDKSSCLLLNVCPLLTMNLQSATKSYFAQRLQLCSKTKAKAFCVLKSLVNTHERFWVNISICFSTSS